MIVNWQLLPENESEREGVGEGAMRWAWLFLRKQQAKDFCVCALEKVANWILVFEFCELKTSASNFSSVKLLPRLWRDRGVGGVEGAWQRHNSGLFCNLNHLISFYFLFFFFFGSIKLLPEDSQSISRGTSSAIV